MFNNAQQPKTLNTFLANIQYVPKQQKQEKQQHGHCDAGEEEEMAQLTRRAACRHQHHHRDHIKWNQIELIYRAEGNANLVLALPQFKKVLRLPKMQPSRCEDKRSNKSAADTSSAATTPTDINARGTQHDSMQQDEDTFPTFVHQHQRAQVVENLAMEHMAAYIEIIRHLLGTEFILEVDVIHIPALEDKMWINEHIRSSRPVHRRDKEFCGHFGLLLPDATLLPRNISLLTKHIVNDSVVPIDNSMCCNTFAIEIKPKQGWLLPIDANDLFQIPPSTETFSAKTSKLHLRCRYCAMQHLKLHAGKIKELSAYCPIELFSGVHTRMLDALAALFECPQNNLRIFRNGALIYGDHIGSLSSAELFDTIFKGIELWHIKHLLVTCLLRDFQGALETNIEIPSAAERASPTMMGKETAKCSEQAAVVTPGQPHSTAAATLISTTTSIERVIWVRQKAAIAVSKQTATMMPATTTSTTTSWPVTTTGAQEADVEASTETQASPKAQTQINEAEMLCLPKNCILQKILSLQLLAKKNLRYMFNNTTATKSVKSYKTLETLLRKTFDPKAAIEHLSFDDLSNEEQYLLGATALDCSIMVTFNEVTKSQLNQSLIDGNPHVVNLSTVDKTYLVNVTVLDLDPKPDSHCHKYVQQTKEAFNCLSI